MKFENFLTPEFANKLLSEIHRNDLLSLYNSDQFYLLLLVTGKNRDISPLLENVIELNKIDVLIDLIVTKNFNRWLKIDDSLSKNFNAFDNEIEKITSNQEVETNTTNNFDVFANIDNDVPTKNKSNTLSDSLTKNDMLTKTKTSVKDFNRALNTFIRSTENNLLDIVVSDVIDILTIDIY